MALDPFDAATASDAATPTTATYVTFDLGQQTFGVDVAHVREILASRKISHLPNAVPGCEGVFDTRGESVPLIDLAGRLGLPRPEAGADMRIVVLELEGPRGRRPVGVVAERVLDVIPITGEAVEAAPDTVLGHGGGRGILGLTRLEGALVILLEPAAILGGLAEIGSLEFAG